MNVGCQFLTRSQNDWLLLGKFVLISRVPRKIEISGSKLIGESVYGGATTHKRALPWALTFSKK